MAFEKLPETDTAVCPLCGEPNHCTLAADPEATECWCDKLEFPQQILEQVPAGALQRACICRNCLERFINERTGAD
jgi:hypothetical protein